MDKILAIQTSIGKLTKDKTNPFFKSSYFDINQIIEQLLPLLEKYNIVVTQPLTNLDGKPAILTSLHDGEHGSTIISSVVPLPDLQDPQKMGSAITYYRRYALQSLFLLQADDDDGNKGAGKKKGLRYEQGVEEQTMFDTAMKTVNGAKDQEKLTEIEKRITASTKLDDGMKDELKGLIVKKREELI